MMRTSSAVIKTGTRSYAQIIAAKPRSTTSKFKQSAPKFSEAQHKVQPIPVSGSVTPFANKSAVKLEIDQDSKNKKNFVNPHGIPVKGRLAGMLAIFALFSFLEDDDF